MTPVLHLRGPVLVGPDEDVGQAWVVGGRIPYERPAGGEADGQGAGEGVFHEGGAHGECSG